jgi:hypothetical protein
LSQIKDYGLARSKWNQHAAMRKDPILRGMLVPTETYTVRSLARGLKRFSVLFLKPEIGGQGRGIMKIERVSSGFLIRYGTHRQLLKSSKEVLSSVHRKIGNKPYILQKGIDLLTIQGRPIDFRVLLLKPENEWLAMGVMGKWAKKNKVVTNYSQGGQAITVKQALSGRKKLNAQADEFVQEVSRLGKYLAEKYFNYSSMFCLDIAIDKNGKLWIIEGNTRPGYKLFRFHQDRQLYPRISRYVKHLRRKK